MVDLRKRERKRKVMREIARKIKDYQMVDHIKRENGSQ